MGRPKGSKNKSTKSKTGSKKSSKGKLTLEVLVEGKWSSRVISQFEFDELEAGNLNYVEIAATNKVYEIETLAAAFNAGKVVIIAGAEADRDTITV